eukprot:761235-Hanusia_phi.AAC.1
MREERKRFQSEVLHTRNLRKSNQDERRGEERRGAGRERRDASGERTEEERKTISMADLSVLMSFDMRRGVFGPT